MSALLQSRLLRAVGSRDLRRLKHAAEAELYRRELVDAVRDEDWGRAGLYYVLAIAYLSAANGGGILYG